MGRPKRAVEVPLQLREHSPEVKAHSIQPHALNFLVSNLTFYELDSLAYLRDTSVSDLVRLAIADAFQDLEEQQPDFIRLVSKRSARQLEAAVATEAWKARVLSTLQPEQP